MECILSIIIPVYGVEKYLNICDMTYSLLFGIKNTINEVRSK